MGMFMRRHLGIPRNSVDENKYFAYRCLEKRSKAINYIIQTQKQKIFISSGTLWRNHLEKVSVCVGWLVQTKYLSLFIGEKTKRLFCHHLFKFFALFASQGKDKHRCSRSKNPKAMLVWVCCFSSHIWKIFSCLLLQYLEPGIRFVRGKEIKSSMEALKKIKNHNVRLCFPPLWKILIPPFSLAHFFIK